MPKVVTLCGSTKFKEDFERVNRELTLQGNIVISVGLFGHVEGVDIGTDDAPTPVKIMLDELHLRKIDMADYVYVVNPGGYIGTSTKREIAYADNVGVPVRYMEAL